jgi:hypothetical protein
MPAKGKGWVRLTLLHGPAVGGCSMEALRHTWFAAVSLYTTSHKLPPLRLRIVLPPSLPLSHLASGRGPRVEIHVWWRASGRREGKLQIISVPSSPWMAFDFAPAAPRASRPLPSLRGIGVATGNEKQASFVRSRTWKTDPRWADNDDDTKSTKMTCVI